MKNKPATPTSALPNGCHDPPSAVLTKPRLAPKPAISSGFPCARVDSNHHGEISPQGPQPRTRRADPSAGVQIVQIAGFRGRTGRIWSGKCCHDVATRPRRAEEQRSCFVLNRLDLARTERALPHPPNSGELDARAPDGRPGDPRFKSCLPDREKACKTEDSGGPMRAVQRRPCSVRVLFLRNGRRDRGHGQRGAK
jgi:hypothetical protein